MTSFQEYRDKVRNDEYMYKVAAVKKAYGADPVLCQALNEAIDMIKVAQDKGELEPMLPSDALTLASRIVEDNIRQQQANALETLVKRAEEILVEKGIEDETIDKLAEAERFQLGQELWTVLEAELKAAVKEQR